MSANAEIRHLLQSAQGRGARPDAQSAYRLWGAILDGAVPELELGAAMSALAAGGETPEELAGCHGAVRERLARWTPAADGRVLAIPAYGLVPGEAFAVGLAVALLRRFGIPVVVHGVLESHGGESAARVLRELGVMPCLSFAQADLDLQRAGAAFVPVQLLSPAFASVLALRGRLGSWSSAHRISPAIDPGEAGSVRLTFSVPGTPTQALADLQQVLDGDFVALAWPAERTPASPGIRPRIAWVRDGACDVLFEAEPQETRSARAPPPENAAGIAGWIRRVAAGAVPAPLPALNVIAACLCATGRAPGLSEAKAVAALTASRLAA